MRKNGDLRKPRGIVSGVFPDFASVDHFEQGPVSSGQTEWPGEQRDRKLQKHQHLCRKNKRARAHNLRPLGTATGVVLPPKSASELSIYPRH